MSVKNLGKAFTKSTGKQRFIYFAVAAMGIGAIAYNVGGGSDAQVDTANVQVANHAASIAASDVSGRIDTKEYKELLIESEKQRVKEAKSQGKSSVAAITDLETILIEPKETAPAKQKAAPINQQAIVAHQAKVDAVNAQIEAMRQRERQLVGGAMDNLFSSNVHKTHQVVSYGGEGSEIGFAGAGNGTGNVIAITSPTESESVTSENLSEEPRILIGSIIPAVLEMKINSDTPTPIKARIVDGSLKGAVLVGNFETFEEAVVIKFTTLTKGGKVAAIDVVAIDPTISSAAIATDVNHRYIYRYGMLAGSTFVSGMAEAISDSGTTVTATTTGTITSSAPVVDINKQIWAGVSDVGKEIAGIAKEEFNTPNTITVDKNTLLGIMFVKSATESWLPKITPDK